MNSGVQTASHADRVQIITWTHSFFTLCGYARHYWDNIVTVNKRISCQEMDYNDANVTRHISLMTAIWNSSVLNYIVWSQFLSLQYCSLVQKVMNISPHSFLVSPAPEDKELHFVAHLSKSVKWSHSHHFSGNFMACWSYFGSISPQWCCKFSNLLQPVIKAQKWKQTWIILVISLFLIY